MNARDLADLWARRAPAIRRYAARKLKDHDAAEDVAAQAYVRLAEKTLAGYKPDDPEGLLDLIARGLVFDQLRAQKREIPVGLNVEEPLFEPDTAEDLGGAWDVDYVFLHDGHDRALRMTLTDDERDAYILTELRGLTVRETAELTGAGKSTVARLSEAAKTSIREELR